MLKTPGKNPSGYSSYSYEVTFGSGTLGINLQATRSGKGAYVDSFHRPPDNSILPAEQSRYIKLGDLVLEINGEDVSDLSLSEIPKVIERAKRPVTIKFERGNMELEFVDVVRDPRKLPWFMQYIVEKYGIDEAIQEQAKLMLWLECEQFIENKYNVPDCDYSDQAYMILKKFFRPDSSFSLLLHVPEKIRSSMLIALADAESGDNNLLQDDHIEINSIGIGIGVSVTNSDNSTGKRRGTPIPKICQNKNDDSNKIFLKPALYHEAQKWAEVDMKSGSFKNFCSSKMGARMTGHLRYSPPFVKISLSELLGCDKKSVFLLLYLCQLKRHGILHCYELLKNRPEDNIEGGIPAAEEMIRIAAACVHVLGLQEERSGIEDLWMLSRLAELIPPTVEQPSSLTNFMMKSISTSISISTIQNSTTYFETLQHDISLSIPMLDSYKALARSSNIIVGEIRECLRELRTTLLRELATEIVPKFFASHEFEILLWELDAHKLYLLSHEKQSKDKNIHSTSDNDTEEDELIQSFDKGYSIKNRSRSDSNGSSNGSTTSSSSLNNSSNNNKGIYESIGPAVPDGAVQRLLRKLSSSLPSSITMHRAPLDLMDTVQQEKESWHDEPMAWILLFDTEGGKLEYSTTSTKNNNNNNNNNENNSIPSTEKIKVISLIPLYPEKGILTSIASTELFRYPCIPEGIVSFLAPTGRCVSELKENNNDNLPSTIFNMALTTRDNSLMYGCTLLLQRRETISLSTPNSIFSKSKTDDIDTLVDRFEKTSSTSSSSSNNNNNLNNNQSKISNTHTHVPAGIHRSHRPAPHTPKSSFKPVPLVGMDTPINSKAQQQHQHQQQMVGISNGYSEWIGQMSLGFENMKSKSPFFDRFKDGISTIGAVVGTKPSFSTVNKDQILERTIDDKIDIQSRKNISPDNVNNNRNNSNNEYEYGNNDYDDDDIINDDVISNNEYLNIQNDGIISHKVIVNLSVSYGLSIVTRVPTINSIRRPLCELFQDETFQNIFLKEYNSKRLVSSTWGEDILNSVYNIIENQHDSLKSLRQLFHHNLSLISSGIPSVMRWGGAYDLEALMILNTLTPKNFVTILIAFLLEYKIAVVSSKLSVLTVMGELLKSIIAPLKWSHVYVPLIPKQFNNDILQCPTPFFVGVQREFFDASSIPNDVILLDIDSDACRITSELAQALYAGRILAESLEKILRPSLFLCDEINPSIIDINLLVPNVLRICKLFIADILIGTEECCTYAVDHNELVVLFDEVMYSNYKIKRFKIDGSSFPYDKGFIEQFMRTQCFSLCLVGNILKKLDPNSRPPSRPSSPFVTLPTPNVKSESSPLPSTPVQYS